MDKKLKSKWLKALRSGEYKQGQAELWDEVEDEDMRGVVTGVTRTHCCLGVLCEVAGLERDCLSNGYKDEDGTLRTSWGELSSELITRFGFLPETQVKLIAMNDGQDKNGNHTKKPKSFKQIAAWIEKNL